jgi:acyl-CoA thioester hydrolase
LSEEELKKFKHKFPVRVRNYHVDSQGIVHNAIYLEYCETGRVEYARNLGIRMMPTGNLNTGITLIVKRNEINYEAPANVDDLIDVYTRISYIKNSSFCFEHVILDSETGKLLVTQKSVQVNLNPQTRRPERLPGNLRDVIVKFEGKDVEIIN